MGEDPFDKSAQPSKRASSKTIGDIVDRFTAAKKDDHKSGLITARTLKQVSYEIGRLKERYGRVSIEIHSDEYQPKPVYKDSVIVGRRQVLPHPQETLDALLKDHPELGNHPSLRPTKCPPATRV